MKITKYLHSCLLIEDEEHTILLDPGNNAYDERVLQIDSIVNIDYIFITHEHTDHMHIPFIKAVQEKFPHVKIVTNNQTVQTLAKDAIIATTTLPEFASAKLIAHEHVFGMGQMCENSEFTFMNTLTHPGDSFQSGTSAKIFALPMQAPWGDLTEAIEHVVDLKPEFVLPIHDWHWKDAVRFGIYDRVEQYLKTQNITFIPLETGVTVELS